MSTTNTEAQKLKINTGVQAAGEPPVATLARAFVNPKTSEVVAYVNAAGDLVIVGAISGELIATGVMQSGGLIINNDGELRFIANNGFVSSLIPSPGVNVENIMLPATTGTLALDTLATYTVVGVPSAAANARKMIYVSNEAGGATPAFSDGTNWRRFSDRAIIS